MNVIFRDKSTEALADKSTKVLEPTSRIRKYAVPHPLVSEQGAHRKLFPNDKGKDQHY